MRSVRRANETPELLQVCPWSPSSSTCRSGALMSATALELRGHLFISLLPCLYAHLRT